MPFKNKPVCRMPKINCRHSPLKMVGALPAILRRMPWSQRRRQRSEPSPQPLGVGRSRSQCAFQDHFTSGPWFLDGFLASGRGRRFQRLPNQRTGHHDPLCGLVPCRTNGAETQACICKGSPPAILQEISVSMLPEEDPHQCIACHEDPKVHRGQFGLDCVRCHTLEAWIPASLTRHTFALDHGDQGDVACETCHIETYAENTCYECHDHQAAQMAELHQAEGIDDYDNCQICHPTGATRRRSGNLARII